MGCVWSSVAAVIIVCSGAVLSKMSKSRTGRRADGMLRALFWEKLKKLALFAQKTPALQIYTALNKCVGGKLPLVNVACLSKTTKGIR